MDKMIEWYLEHVDSEVSYLYELKEVKEYTVGRRSDHDIVSTNHLVSRVHAVLSVQPQNLIYVKDLESANGTFINDFKILPHKDYMLTSEDLLGFGAPSFATQIEKEIFKVKFRKKEATVQNEIVLSDCDESNENINGSPSSSDHNYCRHECRSIIKNELNENNVSLNHTCTSQVNEEVVENKHENLRDATDANTSNNNQASTSSNIRKNEQIVPINSDNISSVSDAESNSREVVSNPTSAEVLDNIFKDEQNSPTEINISSENEIHQVNEEPTSSNQFPINVEPISIKQEIEDDVPANENNELPQSSIISDSRTIKLEPSTSKENENLIKIENYQNNESHSSKSSSSKEKKNDQVDMELFLSSNSQPVVVLERITIPIKKEKTMPEESEKNEVENNWMDEDEVILVNKEENNCCFTQNDDNDIIILSDDDEDIFPKSQLFDDDKKDDTNVVSTSKNSCLTENSSIFNSIKTELPNDDYALLDEENDDYVDDDCMNWISKLSQSQELFSSHDKSKKKSDPLVNKDKENCVPRFTEEGSSTDQEEPIQRQIKTNLSSSKDSLFESCKENKRKTYAIPPLIEALHLKSRKREASEEVKSVPKSKKLKSSKKEKSHHKHYKENISKSEKQKIQENRKKKLKEIATKIAEDAKTAEGRDMKHVTKPKVKLSSNRGLFLTHMKSTHKAEKKTKSSEKSTSKSGESSNTKISTNTKDSLVENESQKSSTSKEQKIKRQSKTDVPDESNNRNLFLSDVDSMYKSKNTESTSSKKDLKHSTTSSKYKSKSTDNRNDKIVSDKNKSENGKDLNDTKNKTVKHKIESELAYAQKLKKLKTTENDNKLLNNKPSVSTSIIDVNKKNNHQQINKNLETIAKKDSTAKNISVMNKDSAVTIKNIPTMNKDSAVIKKDNAVINKSTAVTNKESAVINKDSVVIKKDGTLKGILNKSLGKEENKNVKHVRFNDEPKIIVFQIDPGNSIGKSVEHKDAPLPNNALKMHFEDKIISTILNWKPLWLEEQKNVTESPPLTTRKPIPMCSYFNSVSDYFEIMTPLMLFELWKSIYNDWIFHPTAVKMAHLDYVQKNADNEFSLFCHCLVGKIDQDNYPWRGDLLILDLKFKSPNGVYSLKKFGYVTNVSKNRLMYSNIVNEIPDQNIVPEYKIKFTVLMTKYPNTPDLKLIDDHIIRIRLVSRIGPPLRIFKSMTCIEKSPLCNFILKPTIQQYKVSNRVAMKNIKDDLNSEQLMCLYEAYQVCTRDKPGIYLIQGPPGTGKSFVIKNLVRQLLSDSNSKRCRILLCAPSNGAVDEITNTLLEMRKKMSKEKNRFKMIRLGPPNSILNANVKMISVSELVTKHINTTKTTLTHNNVYANEEKQFLENKICTLKNTISEKKAKNIDTHAEEQTLKLSLHEYEKFITLALNDLPYHEKKKYEREKEMYFIENAEIVCSTLSSCVGSRIIDDLYNKKRLEFTCCIIDEATQGCEQENLIPLMLGIKRFVLVGDSQQLSPTIMSKEARDLGYGKSLFTRIQKCLEHLPDNPIRMLSQQYRMHSEICKFPSSAFYGGRLSTSNVVNERAPSILRPYSLFCLNNVADFKEGEYLNKVEADLVLFLSHIILVRTSFSIGIITPYTKQKNYLLHEIKARNFENQGYHHRLVVNTVDGFQGQERDVIIISSVRYTSNIFLNDQQRLNVALTRGKYAVYICGHANLFKSESIWKDLEADAKRRNVYHSLNNVHLINEEYLSNLILRTMNLFI